MKFVFSLLLLMSLAAVSLGETKTESSKAASPGNDVVDRTLGDRTSEDVKLGQQTKLAVSSDLVDLREKLKCLEGKLEQLTESTVEQTRKYCEAEAKLNLFRDAHVLSAKCGRSVDVQGEQYTSAQLETQIRLLMAELKGFELAKDQMHATLDQAEGERANLVVMINYLVAQESLLDVNQLLATLAENEWKSLAKLEEFESDLQARFDRSGEHPFLRAEKLGRFERVSRPIVSDEEFNAFINSGSRGNSPLDSASSKPQSLRIGERTTDHGEPALFDSLPSTLPSNSPNKFPSAPKPHQPSAGCKTSAISPATSARLLLACG